MEPAPISGRTNAVREARRLLTPTHWFLLALLSATSFFEGYDRGILGLALNQIRDTFDLSQAEASVWIAVLFAGAVPALFVTRWADRIGRRRVLLVSITGYTLATGLTALAPTMGAYVACQFVARLFITAEAAVVWTMAAEELPAGARGYGFGLLSMAAALGVGFGAILYGGFLEPAGVSWRWMYVVGLPPLVLVAGLRRRLPESGRFLAAQAEGRLAEVWHRILQPPHRRWLVLVLVTASLGELATQAGVFALDFLQDDRGLSTTTASFMLVFAGVPAMPIMVVAGGLSDRYGRRLVGCAFAVMSLTGAMAFFWLPGGVPVLLPALSLLLIGSLGSFPVLSAYTAELFPTALRGQAGAWASLARVSGQSASLVLGGARVAVTGGLSPAGTILSLGPVAAIVLFLVWFPETHGRELEDIAPDDVAPTASTTTATAVTALAGVRGR